jgi:chromosome segregation ATPase
MKKFERVFYWVIILGIVGFVYYYYYTSVDKNYQRFLDDNKRSQAVVDSLAGVNDLYREDIARLESNVDELDIKISSKDTEISNLRNKVRQASEEVKGWAGDDLVNYLITRYSEIEIPADFVTNDNVEKLLLPETIVRVTSIDLVEGDGIREELELTQEKLNLTEVKIANLDSIILKQSSVISNCQTSTSILQDNLNSCQTLASQQNTRIQVQSDQIKRLSKATLRNIGIVATLITIGQLIF